MSHNIIDSVLRYRGIDVPFIKTNVFRQEPVWSPDGTDLLYTHVTIGVSGILNACFLDGNNPSDWIESVRPILMQRGGQLYFFIGGVQTIPPPGSSDSYPPNNSQPNGNELVSSPVYQNPGLGIDEAETVNEPLDAKLGPKPIRLDIKEIRGGTYSIYYEIETWLPYCSPGAQPAPVLSNRWESNLSVDKDYFYTRTTTGTMIINGQYIEGQPAQTIIAGAQAAGLLFPGLPPSWKREIRTNLSSDGLILSYTLTDTQQYVAIPRPATHIEASYAEVMPASQQPTAGVGVPMLNFQQLNIDITVSGDPGTNIPDSYPTGSPVNPDKLKYTLMQIMFVMAFSRLKYPFLVSDTKWGQANTSQNFCMITHFEIREDVMRPVVGCRIIAFQTRQQTANIFAGSATWNSNIFQATMVGAPLLLGDMINQVSTQPCSIANFATFLFLQSVAPKSTCSSPSVASVAGEYRISPTTVYTTQTSTAQTSIGTAYQTIVNNSFSTANYNYPFTDYTAKVDYQTEDNVLQLPVMYDVEQNTPGTTKASSAFCQTASPTTRKVIHWRASRLGTFPTIPQPSAVDTYYTPGGGPQPPQDKPLRQTISFPEIELSNDGLTRHYAVSGVYEIGMARRLQWDVASTYIPIVTNPVIGSSFYPAYAYQDQGQDSTFPTNSIVSGYANPGPSPANV